MKAGLQSQREEQTVFLKGGQFPHHLTGGRPVHRLQVADGLLGMMIGKLLLKPKIN